MSKRLPLIAWVGLIGIVVALALPAQAAPIAQGEPEGQLEVFSWWTSGSEAAALETLTSAYSEAFPDVELTNAAVSGGAGGSVQAVLQSRLVGGSPPDTWQTNAGWVLRKYVDPGFVQPITDLYEEEGWFDVMPEGITNQLSFNGDIYAVPIGVHRGNTLWFNKKLLEEHGIAVDSSLTWDQFFEIADTLQAAGIPAVCMGDNVITLSAELFENTLLGTLGPEKYRGLWDGTVPFDDPAVTDAIATYGRLLDYQNDDHAALSWDQSVQKLVEGGCAFSSQGDWALGELKKANQEENVDFGWVNAPGTDGAFMVVSDSFVIAEGAPNPVNAREWLRVIGDPEVQAAFSPIKGSIPPRTDVSRDNFGPYQNWSMDSFAADELVSTVVFGGAAPPEFQQALYDACTAFVASRDAEVFQQALVTAAASANFGS
jgi:glucose/mannose transport system substrate-binding protein